MSFKNEIKIHSVQFAVDAKNKDVLLLDVELVSGRHRQYIATFFHNTALSVYQRWNFFFRSNEKRKTIVFPLRANSCKPKEGRLEVTWKPIHPVLIMDSIETAACSTVAAKKTIPVNFYLAPEDGRFVGADASLAFTGRLEDLPPEIMSDSFVPSAVVIDSTAVRTCVEMDEDKYRMVDVDYSDCTAPEIEGELIVEIEAFGGAWIPYLGATVTSVPDIGTLDGTLTFNCGLEADMPTGNARYMVILRELPGGEAEEGYMTFPESADCE